MGEPFREYVGDIFVQDGSESGTLGSICWAPVLYTTHTVNVVRPVVKDPAAPGFGQYTVSQVSLASIANVKAVPFEHRFPDRNLRLTLGEDLFVIRGKVRPVIVLFNPRAAHEVVVKDEAKAARDVGMCLGCVPLYTLVDAGGNFTHRPVFVENVRAMKYAQYCYLPGHSLLQDDRETFARLDRLTWFPPELLQPTGVKMNAIGMDYLSAWNNWLTRGDPLPEGLADVRDLFMAELESARAVAAKKKAGP